MNVIIEDWKDFRDIFFAFKASGDVIYWDSDEYFKCLWKLYQCTELNIGQIQSIVGNAWQYQVFGSIRDIINKSVFNEWKNIKEFGNWCCNKFPDIDKYCEEVYDRAVKDNGDEEFDFCEIFDEEIDTIIEMVANEDLETELQKLCEKYQYEYVLEDAENILIVMQ